MSKKFYVYKGSVTGARLEDGNSVMLNPGSEVSLPSDDGYVKTLIALGRLEEVPQPEKKQTNKPRHSLDKEVKNGA